jgi:sugar lactone lactonase YvrE
MTSIRCVARPRAEVGEGPVWDHREQVLYWIDIKTPRLVRFDSATGENRATPLAERIGCLAVREQGGLIAALETGFKWLDPATGALEPLLDPEPDKPQNRFNDGKCDRRGRFFAGSMDDAERACTGTLYRLDPDHSVHVMRSDVHLANGLDWSPDGRVMYFTDSLRRTIYAFDYDPDTGAMSGERVFATVAEEAGVPDGLTVDAEGFVWSAHWGGWRLTRYAPDGRIERVVEMPVPQPSSCCFGGADLDVLYVTSAAIEMTAADLEKAPDGGGLFALDAGVAGLPMARFAG